MKRKKIAAFFMLSALSIATLAGCDISDGFPGKKNEIGEISKSFTVKLPQGAGEIVDIGMFYSDAIASHAEYVICKNKNGTFALYVKGVKEERWVERNYVPGEKPAYTSPYSNENSR